MSENLNLDNGLALAYAQSEQIQGNAGFKATLENLGLNELPSGLVLDLGAGTFGALQYEASVLSPSTEIVSYSPVYDSPYTQDILEDYLRYTAPEVLPDIAEEIAEHSFRAVAGLAEHLPFRNDSFDMVVSHAAIPTYLLAGNGGAHYRAAFMEALRVVKTGGAVVMGPMRENDLKLALTVLGSMPGQFNARHEEVEKPDYTYDKSDWFRIILVKEAG